MRKFIVMLLIGVVTAASGATLMTIAFVWRKVESAITADIMRAELFMTWGAILASIGIVLTIFACCSAGYLAENGGTK